MRYFKALRKSTALKLAAGLYEPTKGSVTLDDINFQIDPNFLRNQILLLKQNLRSFLGTLRENLDLARMDGFSGYQKLPEALARFDNI